MSWNIGLEGTLPFTNWKELKTLWGKRENAGYWHFLLFPQCFQKASDTGSLKVVIVW